MKKITDINKIFMLLMLVLSISACKKYNEWPTDEQYDRLFRPTSLTATIEGVTVSLHWKEKPGASKYVVELSKDSLEFTTIIKTYEGTSTKDDNGAMFLIPEPLDANTLYSARIKALSDTKEESGWAAVAFRTKSEQIMQTISIADIGPREVTLRWTVPNNVTHFTMNGVQYNITADEKTKGEKVISGLVPKTQYEVILYNVTAIRGQQTFITKADIPTGQNVIEVGPADDLAALLAQPHPAGTTFVLLQGSKYTVPLDPVILPTDASFTIWGEDGPNKAILAFNGITLPALAGTIKFENLDITGYENFTTGTKRNYIFNQSVASQTEQVVFENCTIRNFTNSVFRIQSANTITIGTLSFNNCTIYDIGDNNANGTYAFIHTNVATGKIENISITNSTIYKIGYGLILHSGIGSQTLKIENNTFDNTVGNARYFIDYNAQPVSGLFSLKNNIIGKLLSPTNTARGIRAAGNTLSVENTYATSDCVFASNNISGLISYAKPSTELFENSAEGNFKIKDQTFAGKATAGDPRWR